MMIRNILIGIIAGATLLVGSVVFAQSGNLDVMNLPKLDQYVTDFAGVLDTSTLSELNQHASEYDQASGHQFVAVLIPDRQGSELFNISLKLFNDNGIGSKKNNDGLLLVIATDEKKIRIMVGYGLEGEMPDTLASQIIENDIRPLVNAGDYAGAVKAFYTRAEEAIAGGEAQNISVSSRGSTPLDGVSWQLFLINAIGFVVVLTTDIIYAIKHRKKKMQKIDKGHWPIPVALVFLLQFTLILSGRRGYIIGPWAASRLGIIIFAGAVSGFKKGKGGFGGGFSSGSDSRSSSFSSSSSSSFSGGGGSSGGGGAGD